MMENGNQYMQKYNCKLICNLVSELLGCTNNRRKRFSEFIAETLGYYLIMFKHKILTAIKEYPEVIDVLSYLKTLTAHENRTT